MPTPDWKRLAERLNDHLSKKRLSSQDVAKRVGVDRKTIDRLRAGRAVRTQTLQWVEQALGVTLEDPGSPAVSGVAAEGFGGYHKTTVTEYIGVYTGYRRSFDQPAQLIASYLEIRWDEQENALSFTEEQHNRAESGKAYDYHFDGQVLIPPNLGVLHLVVRSKDGLVRMATTSMPRDNQGTSMMKGFILTLNEIGDIGYYPVTSPIFFAQESAGVAPNTGVITRKDDRFAWADEILTDIEHKFLPQR